MRIFGILFFLGCSFSCLREEPSIPGKEPSGPTWRPILQEALLATASAALPDVSPDQHRESLDLLDGSGSTGTVARLARRAIQDWPSQEQDARLLKVLEDPLAPVVLRLRAAELLSKASGDGVEPRLVLRLKYEKDYTTSLWIASTLLAKENNSGLSVVHAVLANEEAPTYSRELAAALLRLLPENKDKIGFSNQWQQLLNLEERWATRRTNTRPSSEAQVAEIWRMIQRLSSQPLRPVDDARFVLSRMACGAVVSPLLQVCVDENQYVREHALQTLAWIGYPVGNWCRQQNVDVLAFLKPLMQDVSLQPRVLAALSVAAPEVAAPIALASLREGNYSTRSAAADALLRCAPSSSFAAIAKAATLHSLAPEGAWSLHLLFANTEFAREPGPDPGKGERDRRQQWLELRRKRHDGK